LGVADPQFFRKLERGVSYFIEKHHGEIRYALPSLLDISENRWQWKAPVHEYLEHLEGPNRSAPCKDAWIVFHQGEGARSQGVSAEEKFLRDARVLQQELRTNPRDTRSQFYLAQSYKHAGQLQQALEAYRKRVEMDGFAEEKFMAQLEVGRVSILLGKDERVVLREMLKAWELRPSRAEPLHELARYFRERSKYGRAYVFARMGRFLPRPDDSLFVAEDVHGWRLLDELAVAAFWVGNYSECKACCEEIFEQARKGWAIPRADLLRVQTNLALATQKKEEIAGLNKHFP
jgi:tetratricopeptide (TPR) repeat protein